jgi:alkylated DNA nucleotide flippase Atl1
LLLENAPAAVRAVAEHMEKVVARLGLVTSRSRVSMFYRPARSAPGMTMYLDGRKIEFDLDSFRTRGEHEFAEDFLDRLDKVAGEPIRRGTYPGVSPECLVEHWSTAESEIVDYYFEGRRHHIGDDGEPHGLDVELLHRVLRGIPRGKWTTYGDVAVAVQSHARAVGGHIGSCGDCENAWRVLQAAGTVSPGFRWSDGARTDDPQEVLVAEGVRFVGGTADRDDRVSLDDLISS